MDEPTVDIAVIGGGAAGFFAAIHAAESGGRVSLFEKSNKLLSKVRVSGGGRCNVTHEEPYASQLVNHYPRGGKSLRKSFELFGTADTKNWFEKRGVKLKVEADGRVFPVSDDSESIVNVLMEEAKKLQVSIQLKAEIVSIKETETGFCLESKSRESVNARKVIVATGGNPKLSAYAWLADLGLNLFPPIPSLFTFNIPENNLSELKGLSVKAGSIKIPGSKWENPGPLLITHWGLSAPAVIVLSSLAAVDLHARDYKFPILVNWCGQNEDAVRAALLKFGEEHPKKLISSNPQFDIPSRLWNNICQRAEINDNQKYADLPKKIRNKLIEILVRDPFQVDGKTTFKEEFVTCGGIDLSEVNLKTFESKKLPGLYFAGEVLNVDGLTGGFNFQHAWTSGYLAGSNSVKSLR